MSRYMVYRSADRAEIIEADSVHREPQGYLVFRNADADDAVATFAPGGWTGFRVLVEQNKPLALKVQCNHCQEVFPMLTSDYSRCLGTAETIWCPYCNNETMAPLLEVVD